jgi:preprotein translocase subunit YajC
MLNHRDFWLSAKENAVEALSSFAPLLMIVGVFYLLMIRPQVKKQKEHQAVLDALKQGDMVCTRGGLIGKVSGINGKEVVIELQEKVRVRVLRSYIDGKYEAAAAASAVSDLKAA